MKILRSQVSVANDILGPAVYSPGDVIGCYIETHAALESVVKSAASKSVLASDGKELGQWM